MLPKVSFASKKNLWNKIHILHFLPKRFFSISPLDLFPSIILFMPSSINLVWKQRTVSVFQHTFKIQNEGMHHSSHMQSVMNGHQQINSFTEKTPKIRRKNKDHETWISYSPKRITTDVRETQSIIGESCDPSGKTGDSDWSKVLNALKVFNVRLSVQRFIIHTCRNCHITYSPQSTSKLSQAENCKRPLYFYCRTKTLTFPYPDFVLITYYRNIKINFNIFIPVLQKIISIISDICSGCFIEKTLLLNWWEWFILEY